MAFCFYKNYSFYKNNIIYTHSYINWKNVNIFYDSLHIL